MKQTQLHSAHSKSKALIQRQQNTFGQKKFVVEGFEEFQDALFRASASMEDLARALQELCASGKPAPQSQRYVELEDNHGADNHNSC